MNSRKIKFRVYDEKYRCWDNEALIIYPNCNILKQGRIIQQYTGMLDKNGKEIYEGDILLLNKGSCYESLYEVIFDSAEYYLISLKRDGDKYGVYTRKLTAAVHNDLAIVIGNVLDDPELLK